MQDYYFGVDVSKGYSNFVMFDSSKRHVESDFQLDDTFEGHQKLYSILSAFCHRHPQARIWTAVESTGGYENNWFDAFVCQKLIKLKCKANLVGEGAPPPQPKQEFWAKAFLIR